MYKNQFDNEFSSGKKYNGYLFWGACDYLVESYGEKIAKYLANGDDIQKVYFDEYNIKNALDYLSSSSLFSSSNVLMIKVNKKIPKKEIDDMISLCNSNPDSFLVLCCVQESDFKSITSSFSAKKNCVDVRFFNPNDNEAVSILKEEASKYNLHIGYNELAYLYNMHQKDLSLSVNDLDKLSILNTQITTNIINAQCFGMGGVSIDELFLKLFSKQNISKELDMIFEEGLNEIAFINQATAFVQQLFTINSYIKLYGVLDIVQIWGYPLPKDIANKRAALAMKFTQEDFLQMIGYLQDLELTLKTQSKIDINSYTQASFRNFSAKLR